MPVLKYNRTTVHIDGLETRTVSTGEAKGGVVAYYAENACGSLTRSTNFVTGKSYDTVVEALEAAQHYGLKVCKTCTKAAEAAIAAEPAPIVDTPKEEGTITATLHTVKIGYAGKTYHLWADGAEKTLCNKPAGTPNVFDHLEATCTTCIQRNTHKEEVPAMARVRKTAATKPEVDVDALTSEVHSIIDEIKAIVPAEDGSVAKSDELSEIAEEKIGQLPTAKRSTLRKQLRVYREVIKANATKASTDVALRPSDVFQVAEDFNEIDGIPDLVKLGAKKAREGVEFGLKMASTSAAVASIILDMRTRIVNPSTGLPDLEAERKVTKNAAGEIYKVAKAAAGVGETDVTAQATYNGLIKSVQNRMSDVLVDWLRAWDTTDSSDRFAVFAELFPEAAKLVAESVKNAKDAEADPDTEGEWPILKPSEAIRAIYKEKGITLPTKGRTELERERQLLKRLEGKRKELDAAKDVLDVEKDTEVIAKLEAEVTKLKEAVPADAKLPPEKTPQEKAFEKLGKATDLVMSATKGADKLSADEKSDLKAKLDKLVSALALEAAKL